MGFKKLDAEDFLVSSNTVTSTVWSNNSLSLNTYYTSSTQKEGSSGPYYLNTYQTASEDSTAQVQFSIAYGDDTGGGGTDFDSSVPGVSPTKTIYGQYRTLILEDENSQFMFGTSFTGSYFYAINIERARYKEKLLPGSFNLILSSSNINYEKIHLTDDSGMVSLPIYYGTQRAYQIISGSDGTSYDEGTGHTPNSGSYGLFLPDISTILLNGAALDDNTLDGGGINLNTDRTSGSAKNPEKLYIHLSGSSGDDVFKLNAEETITSDYIFVRARNSEFNYSENPSFISGTTGEVIFTYFIDNPQVYPTTIGLYNDANELVAVAKMSRPLNKDFTKEILIRIKLDF